MEHLSGTPLFGRLLALSANIILGRKGLPWTNTLAYYEHSKITAVKSFITFAPGHRNKKCSLREKFQDEEFYFET
jgi:hypothetical protein